ncbi:MAG: hypothetical protein JWL84_3682 [Rhodospirillales bacterium]|nr:hypothetical protein [Rhodospirillales bacterium]
MPGCSKRLLFVDCAHTVSVNDFLKLFYQKLPTQPVILLRRFPRLYYLATTADQRRRAEDPTHAVVISAQENALESKAKKASARHKASG